MAEHLSKLSDDALIRTFLAIELPLQQKAMLGSLQRDFATHASTLKMVAMDLLHITVRFLGGLNRERLKNVVEVTTQCAAKVEPFSLSLSGMGSFPGGASPRVLWVGLEDDSGLRSLQWLFDCLGGQLAARGFPREERGFSPHITLGRVRDGIGSGERRRLGETLAEVRRTRTLVGQFDVHDITVMRSELGPSGPKYSPTAVARLGSRDLGAG